jgi:hypothetical protein
MSSVLKKKFPIRRKTGGSDGPHEVTVSIKWDHCTPHTHIMVEITPQALLSLLRVETMAVEQMAASVGLAVTSEMS